MRFVVASHGHCFDGLSSAVLFTRLMHERGLGQAQFETCYAEGQAMDLDQTLAYARHELLT